MHCLGMSIRAIPSHHNLSVIFTTLVLSLTDIIVIYINTLLVLNVLFVSRSDVKHHSFINSFIVQPWRARYYLHHYNRAIKSATHRRSELNVEQCVDAMNPKWSSLQPWATSDASESTLNIELFIVISGQFQPMNSHVTKDVLQSCRIR